MTAGKLVLALAFAFGATTAFASPALACEGIECYVSGGMCADPQTCPVCFEDTYVLGTGPHNICMLSPG